MREPSDVEQLVAAARAGDSTAWDDLVDRYLPLVTGVIGRFRLSASDADDVNQTVWLRLVEHLDGLREPRALPGWLVTTTRNEALQLIRRRVRDLPVDPGTTAFDGVGDDAPDFGAALVSDLRAQALREALDELPEKRRELLLLLLVDPHCPTRRSVPASASPGAASVRPGHVPWNSCAALGHCAAGHQTRPRSREAFAMSYSTDDEGLMVELARALDQVTAVPPNRRLAARGAYTWRTVDEELLALTHDSLELADAAVRGDTGVRTLGFDSDGLSLQVELDGDQVSGQVLSTGDGGGVDSVVVESVEDGTCTSPVDGSGVFSVSVPAGPVRFAVSVDGALRRTPWVVLRPGRQEG